MNIIYQRSQLFLNHHTVSELILLILVLVSTGCAINEVGMVKVRHFENKTLHMISKESWGAYFSTDEADGGFMLGYMNRVLLYPKNNNFNNFQYDKILHSLHSFEQASFHEIKADDQVTLKHLPVAWMTDNWGVMFNANLVRIGIAIGKESMAVLRMPEDFEGVFTLNYTTNGKIRAFFNQERSKANKESN